MKEKQVKYLNNQRIDYSKISGNLHLPNLVEIQTKSYEEFKLKGLKVFKELNKKYKPQLIESENGEMFLAKTINDDGNEFDLEEQQILAYGMIIAWHESRIYRDKFLKQNINTKDFQQLSNATMLMNNNTLYEMSKKEFVKRRRRYRNRDWNGDGL